MKPKRSIAVAVALAAAGSILNGCAYTDADWAAVKYCGLGTPDYNYVLCERARDEQREQASDRRRRDDDRRAAARVRGSREAQLRWREEVRQARLNEASPLHWLNGIWCEESQLATATRRDPPMRAHRFVLMDDDTVLIRFYSAGLEYASGTIDIPASLYERNASIRAVADDYEISYEGYRVIKRERLRFKEFLVVDPIDEDRYRSVTLDGGRQEKSGSRKTYRRCTELY